MADEHRQGIEASLNAPETDRRSALVAPDCSVGGLLRLVGSEASAQILMALGRGPLRTRQLTDRIDHSSARSVYRRVAEMEGCGLICRDQEPGVPSKVVLQLTEPVGRELFRLLRAFADSSATYRFDDAAHAFPWSTLSLLGELWTLGMVEELSYEPRTAAQLARGDHELTFHQVNRRLSLFGSAGLLNAPRSKGIAKSYELTPRGRRCILLIAGIGRWRRHVVPEGARGLTIAEMASIVRAAMSLTTLPGHVGKTIELGVVGAPDASGHREMQTLQGTVDVDGTLRHTTNLSEAPEGSTRGTINTWLAAILDGNRGRMRVRGQQALIDSFLPQLHDVLWDEGVREAA